MSDNPKANDRNKIELVDVDELIIVRELKPDEPGYEWGFSTHSDDTPAPLSDELAAMKAENEKLRTERDEQRIEIISLSEVRQVTPAESAERKELAKRVVAKANAEKAEFAALKSENEKLLAALSEISNLEYVELSPHQAAWNMRAIALQAIKGRQP